MTHYIRLNRVPTTRIVEFEARRKWRGQEEIVEMFLNIKNKRIKLRCCKLIFSGK